MRLVDNYASHWVYQILDGVPEGMRYASAIRLAGRWYSKGLTTIEVIYFLVGWNERNSPPLSDKELFVIVKSTSKWDTSRYSPPVNEAVVNEMVRSIKRQYQKKE
jgi:hypothetical protein